ncbi:hypothetical protein [Reichenbachiella agariperforans]|uniref:hypothetical protein n=1 Tax=Reichenbachiella agariperforans TaxID=156994 RepID=UPI001C08DBA9|nr:hypothetical protein [Reichenbachiella agariperforans]MBU2914551.1 hypothetical protein [Reichenbachiella agariperforans]
MKPSFELRVANGINSLAAVMIPMLTLILAFIIHASTLIYRALPDDMVIEFKLVASAALGFSMVLPLLLTAVNSELLPKWYSNNNWVGFPMLFGVFTIIMTLFFFDVFEAKGKSMSWYFLNVFISLFFGLIDYLYVFLFVAKYKETTNREMESKLQEDYKMKYQQLESKHQQLKHNSKQLKEDSAQYNELLKQLTCKYCGEVKTISSIKSHQARCSKRA